MAESKQEEVRCPKCGAVVRTVIVDALKSGDPELELLFKGGLNRPECPQCGSVFVVERPLVYRDSERPFIMYYMPSADEGGIEQLELEVDSMATDVFMRENLERPIVRLVFSQADFIEKIFIHQLGLDDRIIEYAKLQLFRTIDESQLSRTKHRLFLDFNHIEEEMMIFIVFDKDTLKPVNAVQVPTAEFHALEEEVTRNENVLMELEAAFPGCYVSADRLL